MAIKYVCDLCKKTIKDRHKRYEVNWRATYCGKCWADDKNWPKIHDDKGADI